MLALISLSLAIINLFPFLPLDGGHVFWALAEKVRGRRIPFEVMERAGVVGFVLILLIFVIGLSNDISTLSRQRVQRPALASAGAAIAFCQHGPSQGRGGENGEAARSRRPSGARPMPRR